MRNVMVTIWDNWRFGALLVLVIGTFAGLVSGWLTPRGPLTATQALLTMAAALALGIAAGLIAGKRWAVLLLPMVFISIFELARVSAQGPTVDAISLNSIYGVIAFISGRLMHWILSVVPMMLGAVMGVMLASRLSPEVSIEMGIVGWSVGGLVAVCLILLGVMIARPASTYPIMGQDGEPLPGSVAELVRVEAGGVEQTLMIRGRDVDNPVLLYLAGGPGGTDLGAMRDDTSLESDFVVVTWDQRGTGKSYPSIEPVEKLTLDQMVSDTIEISHYLRDRFDEEKIYLAGNSWGTILGVLAVQQHPELYYAFVGTGQMVSPRATDIMFYEDTLSWAQATGQVDLVGTLEQNGPPPCENLLDYEPVISHEHDWNVYPQLGTSEEMPFNTFVPENSFMDRVNAMRGLLDTFARLYPQLQDIDFREDVSELEVPFYMVMGAHETRGRRVLADEWFEMLSAPHKEYVLFESSGHRPPFEQPADFASLMERVKREIGRTD